MRSTLILASHSPRRKVLLEQLGLKFKVIVDNLAEDPIRGLPPIETVKNMALQKGRHVASTLSKGVVLGADTLVEYKRQTFKKPKFEAEAEKMLQSLSGNTHQVHTGIAIIDIMGNRWITASATTQVTFRNISTPEIKAYIKTGEPMDKAGSYGIQGLGAIFVEKISGSYSNVVGLPLELLAQMLPDFGIRVL
jgi:septum formation protein